MPESKEKAALVKDRWHHNPALSIPAFIPAPVKEVVTQLPKV